MNGCQDCQKSESVPNVNPPIGTGREKVCEKCGAVDRNAKGKCRLCLNAYNVSYYRVHRIEMAASKTRRRKADPDYPKKRNAASAKWRNVNPDKVKAFIAKWRDANYEHVRMVSRKWYVDHPEKIRAMVHKRRARILEAGGSFTDGDIKSMLKRQRKRCVVCRTDISKSYHVDHIMPLARGGDNGIGNIQLLCPHCNFSKNDKHPIDFMQERGFLL